MLNLIATISSITSTASNIINAYFTLVIPEIVEKIVVITGTAIMTIVFNKPIVEDNIV
ncbi:hypothetical protein BC335_2211 [Lactobacillus helveticus]|uniref:Uncharacterized protein n=1 Tax=Lactobacillus helveticus TaxID=1587 RepID=A0A386RGR2_LACHE|nr:hypothetical protein BC335_2211 [Lactobacillus helveticus]